jgi:hypothetical protein
LKVLSKVYLVALLLFVFNNSGAQIKYEQFTLGAGAGPATAYAGADQPQTKAAFYVGGYYYPVQFFNVGLEVQDGTLTGVPMLNSANAKDFSNSYKALILDANLYLGVFFKGQQNGFLNVIQNFYGGLGYGVMFNNINNAELGNPVVTDNVTNTLKAIAFKSGYECTILKNRYNAPLLKADLSARFYYINGMGLDGYYYLAKTYSFYTYYAIGLKYIFIIKTTYGRGYKKYD